MSRIQLKTPNGERKISIDEFKKAFSNKLNNFSEEALEYIFHYYNSQETDSSDFYFAFEPVGIDLTWKEINNIKSLFNKEFGAVPFTFYKKLKNNKFLILNENSSSKIQVEYKENELVF